MTKPTFIHALTFGYRAAILVALILNAWLLRSIERSQYTGPSYTEEQQARQIAGRLEEIEKTISFIEKNTRR